MFRRAANVSGFAMMVAAGFWWLGRPMPNVPPSVDLTFDRAMAERIPPVALAVGVLASLIAAWRWLRIRKVFTEGVLVQGKVVETKTDVWETTANRDQSHGINKETRRSYYITFSYKMLGAEHTVRQKLPHSASTYGLKQGGEVDLMVLDSRPHKPFIRAVYLWRR